MFYTRLLFEKAASTAEIPMKALASLFYALVSFVGGFFAFFSAVWYGYGVAYTIAIGCGAVVAALLYLHGPTRKVQAPIRAFNIPASMASYSIMFVGAISEVNPSMLSFALGAVMCLATILVGAITQTSSIERREAEQQ